MADRVSTDFEGFGEAILKQDVLRRFEGWKSIQAYVTPSFALNLVSHIEASGFNRPGDVPVLVGLAAAGIPAGSPEAQTIYNRAATVASRSGVSWDAPPDLESMTSEERSAYYRNQVLEGQERLSAARVEMGLGPELVNYSAADIAADPSLADKYRPEEEPTTLFGVLKGTSRWGMLAFDFIRDTAMAIGHAAQGVDEGRYTAGEAFAAYLGQGDPQIAQEVGIPLFQYLSAGLRGERLNMGTGLTVDQAEIAPDLQAQLDRFDATTASRNAYQQEVERSGRVYVYGPNGAAYEARNFEEWQHLRNNAGRAGLMSGWQYSSPEQAGLGQPYGAFHENIFRQGNMFRVEKDGPYYVYSPGQPWGALVEKNNDAGIFDPDLISGAVDLFVNVAGPGVLGKSLRGIHAVSKARPFIGLADEAGQTIRGTSTIEDIYRGADVGADLGVSADLARGAVNVDAAANAMVRRADPTLTGAATTVTRFRQTAPRVLTARRTAEVEELVGRGIKPEVAENMVKPIMSPAQLDNMVRRAGKGDLAAGRWFSDLMGESGQFGDELDRVDRIQQLLDVYARGDTDIVKGVFGKAVVPDQIMADAVKRAEDLNTTLGKGAHLISDAEGRAILTFDADLSRAQETMIRLTDAIGDGPKAAGQRSVLEKGLFAENWMQVRRAEKLLGDTPEAAEEVANLGRVLRRNEALTDIVENVTAFVPRLTRDQALKMMTNPGPARDMVEALADANTWRKVMAVFGPSVEFGGKTISPRLMLALKNADTPEEVVAAFMKSGHLEQLRPPKVSLAAGGWATAGNIGTALGGATGGVAGAIEGAEEGEGIPDIIGGALSGFVLGAVAGSAGVGAAAWLGGGTSRTIESMADAMDLVLAGSRAATGATLAAHGADMGRAVQGLSIPAQMSYAFGHSPLGRRLARHAGDHMDLSNPVDLFYKTTDYARSLGIATDDTVTVLKRGSGDAADYRRVVASDYDTAEEMTKAIDDAVMDGFKVSKTYSLDDAYDKMAQITPKNVPAAMVAMRQLFDGFDNILLSRGMKPENAALLTKFMDQAIDDFMANVDAVGQPAYRATELAIGGRVHDMGVIPKLLSEQWSGKITLPPPDKITRAVNQLDRLGRMTQTFTGEGVWGRNGSVARRLRGIEDPNNPLDYTKMFDPNLERNVLARATAHVTFGAWVPMVLLTRPISFISRVFGEDQARMLVEGLDMVFQHPANYFSAVLANWEFWRKMPHTRPRGLAARSLLPDALFDEVGGLVDPADLNHLAEAENVKHALGIYPKEAAKEARMFGTSAWGLVSRGRPNYTPQVAEEFRQLVVDPLVRHMAKTEFDPVGRTLDWLRNTDEGKNVALRWAQQFQDPDIQAKFMSPDVLEAFLHDEYARLHLKTGGDWVFKLTQGDNVSVFASTGNVLDPAKWKDAEDGYHIIRRGDQELLDIVATGALDVTAKSEEGISELRRLRIDGALDDETWDAIKAKIADKHTQFEDAYKSLVGKVADEGTLHRFPENVKGKRTVDARLAEAEKRGLDKSRNDAIETFYQFLLGKRANEFSRQPVLGQYFWERIGLRYHAYTPDVQRRFMALAKAEGFDTHISRISDEVAAADPARNIVDDWDMAVLDAQSYAVERTKDLLFDLTRQRNFIDGMKVVVPFMGPFIEALEAWGRVARNNAVFVWRRGLQVERALWDDDPTPGQHKGTFWVDEDGTEMVTWPLSGPINQWLHDNINQGISPEPLSARSRGFNVVFGGDDLTQGEGAELAGVPLGALNAGIGPVVSVPMAFVLKEQDGNAAAIRDELFPFGIPPSGLDAVLPFHLRKAFEGWLPTAESKKEFVATTMEQWVQMNATGEVGVGPEYVFDISTQEGVDRTWDEARRRAWWANITEAVARGVLPSMISPELLVSVDQLNEMGVNTETLLNMAAISEMARDLFSEEGAKTFQTPDGVTVSTEGDMEAVTQYMNNTLGLDMYSADMLTLPKTRTVHMRLDTMDGLTWHNSHEAVVSRLPDTAHFLIPDYAVADDEDSGQFSFEARDAAIRRGDIKVLDMDEVEAEVANRLMSIQSARIDRDADEAFGLDDELEGEDQDRKNVWKKAQKDRMIGQYHVTHYSASVLKEAKEELRTWESVPWEDYDLTPEEEATVRSVTWFLRLERTAATYVNNLGVTSLENAGSSEEEKEAVALARADVMNVVDAQLRLAEDTGTDLGNFVYLYELFFKPYLMAEDDDPLADLAAQSILGQSSLLEVGS